MIMSVPFVIINCNCPGPIGIHMWQKNNYSVQKTAVSPQLLNGPDFILMPPLSLWQRRNFQWHNNYGSGRHRNNAVYGKHDYTVCIVYDHVRHRKSIGKSPIHENQNFPTIRYDLTTRSYTDLARACAVPPAHDISRMGVVDINHKAC